MGGAKGGIPDASLPKVFTGGPTGCPDQLGLRRWKLDCRGSVFVGHVLRRKRTAVPAIRARRQPRGRTVPVLLVVWAVHAAPGWIGERARVRARHPRASKVCCHVQGYWGAYHCRRGGRHVKRPCPQPASTRRHSRAKVLDSTLADPKHLGMVLKAITVLA